MKLSKYLLYITVIFAILLIEFTYMVKVVTNGCAHATDFSIYQQAIYNIDFFNNLNPYLTIRNIKIFNDHFDPIIYLASIFTNVLGKQAINLIIFEFLWLTLTIFFVFRLPNKKEINLKYILLLLFTKGIFTAIQFPIHPSTWSIFPLFLLFSNIKKDKYIILSAIFLFMFREVFPFGCITLSIALFVNKRTKQSYSLLTLSIFWLIFVYKIRPIWFGEIHNYGSLTLTHMITSPFEFSKQIRLLPAIKILYPFVLPYYFLLRFRTLYMSRNAISFYTIGFLLPILGLHIITNKVHFQYGVFLTAPLLFGLILDEKFKNIIDNTRTFSIILIPFILSSMGTHTKAFKGVFANKIAKCSLAPNVKKSRNHVRSIINKIDLTQKSLLATGGVIPMNLKENALVYQMKLYSKKLSQYDFVLLSRNESSDIYPYSKEEIETIIRKCSFEKIVYQDDYFFLGKNLMDSTCIK